jgi:hypothetical protein
LSYLALLSSLKKLKTKTSLAKSENDTKSTPYSSCLSSSGKKVYSSLNLSVSASGSTSREDED